MQMATVMDKQGRKKFKLLWLEEVIMALRSPDD